MFFSSQLVNALKEDHDQIRAYLMGLNDQELQMGTRQATFSEVAPLIKSHAEREEKVVYNFMRSIPELRAKAEEGTEEHRIVTQLIEQMTNPLPADIWTAKAKVLSELLEKHMDEEESHVFSKIKKHLDSDLDLDLCGRFEEGKPERKPSQEPPQAPSLPAASGDFGFGWTPRF